MEINQTVFSELCTKIPLEETLKDALFRHFSINLVPEIVGLLIILFTLFLTGAATKNLDEGNFWVIFFIVALFWIVARIGTIVMGLM